MTLAQRRFPIAAFAALVLMPAAAWAQGAAPSAPSAVRSTSAAGSGMTRANVAAEVQRAMRDGSWRCATNNRGWCGTTPDEQGVARNPRRR